MCAQLARQAAAVPEALEADFRYVVGLAPALLEELLKISLRPRPPMGAFEVQTAFSKQQLRRLTLHLACTKGYFWLRPALSILEFNQALTQALPVGCVTLSGLRCRTCVAYRLMRKCVLRAACVKTSRAAWLMGRSP
jgi:translocation protein SEC63